MGHASEHQLLPPSTGSEGPPIPPAQSVPMTHWGQETRLDLWGCPGNFLSRALQINEKKQKFMGSSEFCGGTCWDPISKEVGLSLEFCLGPSVGKGWRSCWTQVALKLQLLGHEVSASSWGLGPLCPLEDPSGSLGQLCPSEHWWGSTKQLANSVCSVWDSPFALAFRL